MSEYMENDTVSRLFGAPTGYIGHERSGQLTKSIRQKSSSVVLYDEIEKVHPNVCNTLLQVPDYGSLTKGTGQKGIPDDEAHLKVAEEIKASFRAEFLNRIDEIVIFRALKEEQVKKIVDIIISNVAERIKASNGIELKRVIVRFIEDPLADGVLGGIVREGDSITMFADGHSVLKK
ncbi:unnamed protein product [Linum trigynum]|uniref:ATPase AAA-type core domain-containing protein n=1 Tax=Linum trigynum TaxID=586398 RepID=A0AAV2EZ78_9ROSI